jgi:hypothetical protein
VKLNCPWLTQSTNLATCQTDLGAEKEENAKLTSQLATVNTQLEELTRVNAALLAKGKLLTDGPPQPADADLRVIPDWLLDYVYQRHIGAAYTAGMTGYGDANLWIPRKANIDVFCLYMRDVWLPYVAPYTVVSWTKLNGDVVTIAQVDCDNFADFVKGIVAAFGRWAGIAWSNMWALVKGFMLSGPHAFNTVPTWLPGYDENAIVDTSGPEWVDWVALWCLEPQVMDTQEVEVPMGTAIIGRVVDVVPVAAPFYKIESVMRNTV